MNISTVTVGIDRRALTAVFSRLRTEAGQSNPLPVYRQLAKMGEIIPAPWGGYVVTSYALCDQILRDKGWRVPDANWRRNHSAQWSSPASQQMAASLPMLNPPLHTRERRSLGGLFPHNSLAVLRPFVERAVDRLLTEFTEQLRYGPADFHTLVSEELPIITIGEWMGIPAADYGLLRDLTHDQVFAQELFPTPSQLALSDSATRQLRAYFDELIRARRRNPGSDPISVWLRTWDELEPDRHRADEAVHALALFMILAALETTSHVLSTSVRLLLQYPEQLESLRRNPELVPDAVDEVLRYDAPIHMISRVASTDTRLGDTVVPAGQMVQLMVGAAHHDPERYPDPERFSPGRGASHLAFGAGIHYCAGNALARLEAVTLLTSLLSRSIRPRLSGPARWAPRVAFRRISSLQLTLA
ncbi:cytochrome P450 [Streptomyces sp. NPDC051563]|uniref:cytochrome P450 n=1 Tax=Streptomyces sp. NPDC051563 TaxID=3365659 RepID=UPI0037AD4CC8